MVSFNHALIVASLYAAAAFAAPHPRGGGSDKRGLAYSTGINIQPFKNGGISWAYSWSTAPLDALKFLLPESSFIPMLWGKKNLPNFALSLPAQSKYVLGFNEPDIPGQSHLAPGDAAQTFKTALTPLSGKKSLGTPGVSSSESPGQGLSWMSEFLDKCSDCKINFLVVHWYANQAQSGAQNAQVFLEFVDKAVKFANSKGLDKVWITEFGFTSSGGVSTEDRVHFIKTVLPKLEQNDKVERYAYFFQPGAQNDAEVKAYLS